MLLVASSILLSLCCYHYHPYFGKESHSLRIHLCDVFVLMEHFLRFPPYVCVSVMETFRGRPLMLGENVAVILCFWGGGVLNHPDRLLLVMQFFENRTEMNFLQINYTISSCLRAFYQSHRSAVILLAVTLFSRLLF